MRKIAIIFILAFLLNWLWENLQSGFYLSHQGGPVTQAILLRAAVFDALFIAILAIPFIKIAYFRKRLRLSLLFGFLAGATIEIYALGAGQWAYAEDMFLIPLLNIGFLPALQLGILSYLIYRFVIGGNNYAH